MRGRFNRRHICVCKTRDTRGSSAGDVKSSFGRALKTMRKLTTIHRKSASSSLFNFIPLGLAYNWEPKFLSVHITANILVAASHFLIAGGLLLFIRREKTPFTPMIVLLSAMIVGCGALDVLDVWNTWNQNYWISESVHVMTAVIAVVTAGLLFPYHKRLVGALRGNRLLSFQREELHSQARQLEIVNLRLHEEIAEKARIEGDLAEANQRLEQAQRLAQIGNYEWDLIKQKLTASSEVHRLFGFDPDVAPTNMDLFTQRMHPDDYEKFNRVIKKAIVEEGSFSFDYRIRKSAEEELIVRSQGEVRYNEGVPNKIVGIVQDITARVKTERALNLLSERYRGLLESAPDATVIIDEMSTVEMVNTQAEKTFGMTREELTGQCFRRLIPTRFHRDYERFTESFLTAPRTMSLGTNGDIYFQRRDGHEFPGELAISPMREGDHLHVTCVIRDISEQKQAQKEDRFLLEASDALNEHMALDSRLDRVARLIVSSFADWCIIDILDERGHPSRATVKHINPFKAESVRHLKERYRPLDNDLHWIGTVLRSGQPAVVPDVDWQKMELGLNDAENLRLIRDLELRSYMIVPLHARGRIMGAITFATTSHSYQHDDLKFAEEIGHRVALFADNALLFESAQKAVRARDEMMAVVSHDLKNPLSNLGISLKLIRRILGKEMIVSSEIFDVIDKSELILNQAHHLLTDLLDLAKIEAGKIAIDEKPTSVQALLQRAATLLSPLAAQKKILLAVEPAPPDWTLVCDIERITQVLSNLIGNSIKFTPLGGNISLRVKRESNGYRFAVADTGPGIPVAYLPHLFDRFWQPKETAKLGSGLGLSICKGIVEAHRGRIWVESEVGRGSIFYFVLPKGGVERPVAPRSEAAANFAPA